MNEIYAGIDLGGTKISCVLADEQGILIRKLEKTQIEGDHTVIPRQVERLIDDCCRELDFDRNVIRRVGIASCGPFIRVKGNFELAASNLCGGLASGRNVLPNDWVSIPLQRYLSASGTELVIANDAVAAANAEWKFGNHPKVRNLAYVTWSTGIGAGAVVDGRLVMGKNGNACHLGHTFMDHRPDHGPECGCGDRSHLESYVSGTALAINYGEGLGAKEIFERYRRREAKAQGIIKDCVFILAKGLVNLTLMFDPEIIILGGGVSRHWSAVKKQLEEVFYSSIEPLTAGVKIVASTLEDNLADLSGLSMVIPNEWIKPWKDKKVWLK